MVRSAEELFAIEKMAAASENDKAVAAPAELGGRDGVAERWATTWCGRWFVLSSVPCSSLDMCVICAFFSWVQ